MTSLVLANGAGRFATHRSSGRGPAVSTCRRGLRASARWIEIGEEHHRAADLQVIGIGQRLFVIDPDAVDVRAIGAIKIDDAAMTAVIAKFSMTAGDFGVVQTNLVGGVASNRDDPFVDVEERPLLMSFDHV